MKRHERAIQHLSLAAHVAETNRKYYSAYGSVECAEQEAIAEAELKESIAVLQADAANPRTEASQTEEVKQV